MHNGSLLLLLALQSFVQIVLGQFGPDPRWLNPNGSHPDYTTAYSVGDTVLLSWKALNQSTCDLWLTHHDATTSTFNVSLTKNVDISVAGSYKWTVDVDAATITESNQFVLRFYPAGSPYFVLEFQQYISPGFLIASTSGGGVTSTESSKPTSTSQSSSSAQPSTSPPSTTSSSSSTSSTATNSISNASSSSGTAIPNATSGASSSSSSGGLSNGAKAGIAVGAVVGVLALLAIGCFLGRRYTVERRPELFGGGSRHRRMFSSSESSAAAPPYTRSDQQHAYGKNAHAMAEMPVGQRSRAEVQGESVMVKPGLHELTS